MRIHELLSEDDQLNEVAPIIAGLTIAGILEAISLVLTAWSIYDIYKFIGKYSEDPSKITQEEWNDLWIDLILIAIPGAAKLGKPMVVKMLPKSIVEKGGKWLNTKVIDLIKKKGGDVAKAGEKAGKVATKEIKVGKYTFQVTKAAEEAGKKKFLGLSPILQDVLKWGVTAEFALNYYTQLAELEDQYQRCINGDKTTKLFGNATPQEAYELASEQRKKLLGEVVLGVGLSFKVASRAFGLLGSVGKWVGTTIGGGKWTATGQVLGAVGGAPGKILSWGLSKIVEGGPVRNAAFLAFLQTPWGKEFLENSVVEAFTSNVGGLTAATIDLGIKGLEAAGVTVPDAAKTKIQDPSTDAEKAAASDPTTNVQKSSKGTFINGVQVADERGFQTVGDKMMNDIRADAVALGKPDPTVGIKKDPSKKYDYYGVS
jgi:hypothetical protein